MMGAEDEERWCCCLAKCLLSEGQCQKLLFVLSYNVTMLWIIKKKKNDKQNKITLLKVHKRYYILSFSPSRLSCKTPQYLPCTVAVSLAFLTLHQPHGSQGLPVSLCWSTAFNSTVGSPPPMTTPPSTFSLHSDWLAILIHIVYLFTVSVTRRFMSLGLVRHVRVWSVLVT